MKKILLLLIFSCFFTLNVFAQESDLSVEQESVNIVIPDEMSFTDRFIITELKDLRVDQESLRREMLTEIQEKELATVDRALSYSANTVNFFFVLLTIVIMGFWIVWWKTVWDIKKATKNSLDKEASKIIKNFQMKIEELEKEQKVNILWRQYNILESDMEKMNILDRINYIKPESQYLTIERSNVYLSMWIYDKVIELSDDIISSDRTKHEAQAYFNKACANAMLLNNQDSIDNLTTLLNLAPDYKDSILESEYLVELLKEENIWDLLN